MNVSIQKAAIDFPMREIRNPVSDTSANEKIGILFALQGRPPSQREEH